MSRRGVVMVVAFLVGGPAFAQDPNAEIDKIFSWVRADAPGCAVAVSHQGKLVVNKGYGLADLERRAPITPATIFDAGSVRKQFVAAAMLLLVEEGRVSLTDDVRKFIPELPDYGQKITVDHLLTHTSGLRDWPALLQFATGNPEALEMILNQRGLNFAPGDEWSYSNSGYVLLPMIVARTSGMSFAQFVQKRLFDPLGMKTTSYVTDIGEVTGDRALAYQKDGAGWRLDILLGNARGGAGALATTAADLATWTDAIANRRLGAFLSAKIREPAKLNNGRKLGYARGLFLDANRGGQVVWHTGSANAYKALTGNYPEQRLSIGIMCNAGDDAPGTTALARRIFDVFVPAGAGAEPTAPPPANAAGVDVSGRAGLFFAEETNEPLRLVTNSGRLGTALGGPLVAVSAERFRAPRGQLPFMSQDEFEIAFVSDDVFELRTMEGKVTRYRRARPFVPNADELNAFVGRYDSEELRSFFEASAGANGLLIQINGTSGQQLEFRPVDPDTFQRGNVTLRFRRDATGRVVALDMNNPVFRRVTYTRH
ncbi:MAG TPA: serine hydrolase domain-containing protein [Gemmatimonadaceae bacterium]